MPIKSSQEHRDFQVSNEQCPANGFHCERWGVEPTNLWKWMGPKGLWNPNHQFIDGKLPIILLGFQPSQIGGAGFRNHPQYHQPWSHGTVDAGSYGMFRKKHSSPHLHIVLNGRSSIRLGGKSGLSRNHGPSQAGSNPSKKNMENVLHRHGQQEISALRKRCCSSDPFAWAPG